LPSCDGSFVNIEYSVVTATPLYPLSQSNPKIPAGPSAQQEKSGEKTLFEYSVCKNIFS
jgi:hypothetical protein